MASIQGTFWEGVALRRTRAGADPDSPLRAVALPADLGWGGRRRRGAGLARPGRGPGFAAARRRGVDRRVAAGGTTAGTLDSDSAAELAEALRALLLTRRGAPGSGDLARRRGAVRAAIRAEPAGLPRARRRLRPRGLRRGLRASASARWIACAADGARRLRLGFADLAGLLARLGLPYESARCARRRRRARRPDPRRGGGRVGPDGGAARRAGAGGARLARPARRDAGSRPRRSGPRGAGLGRRRAPGCATRRWSRWRRRMRRKRCSAPQTGGIAPRRERLRDAARAGRGAAGDARGGGALPARAASAAPRPAGRSAARAPAGADAVLPSAGIPARCCTSRSAATRWCCAPPRTRRAGWSRSPSPCPRKAPPIAA